VLVTHDQDEALSVADRVAALRDGTIAQYAAPEDLYCRPVDPGLASFVGEANLLEGVINGAVVKTLLGNLPLDPSAPALGTVGQVTVLIRPEHIELAPADHPLAPPADALPGRVTSYGYHGHDAVLHVQPDRAPDDRTLIVRIVGGPHLPVGSAVTLRTRGPVFAWPRD
jgi:iron(III) transport system ATP-binding protein